MMFYYISAALEPILLTERPISILEISMYGSSGCRYGRLAADCMRRAWGSNAGTYIDRIDIEEKLGGGNSVYRQLLPLDFLDYPEKLDAYDVILVADLLEALDTGTANAFILRLCPKACNKLLVITPESEPDQAAFIADDLECKCITVNAIPEDIRIFTVTSRKVNSQAGRSYNENRKSSTGCIGW